MLNLALDQLGGLPAPLVDDFTRGGGELDTVIAACRSH
jgi:hypothetical protein